ncbi:hypothetical protein LCGC14_2277360 [marine sediment metagenome]|uniref:Uncharacterized protein n=1 Tax=marine sediment metagenome TaxID=412755 RepID=A0A0F9F7Q6_9ZZZZ
MNLFKRYWSWHVIASPAYYLLIVFIIVIALQGCGRECNFYSDYVERFDKCIESPDCMFTIAEFYDYNVAVMRRDAACKP